MPFFREKRKKEKERGGKAELVSGAKGIKDKGLLPCTTH